MIYKDSKAYELANISPLERPALYDKGRYTHVRRKIGFTPLKYSRIEFIIMRWVNGI